MSDLTEQRKKLIFLVFLMIIGFFLLRIRLPQVVRHSQAKQLMGTVIQVDVCSRERQSGRLEKAYEDVWRRLEDISWRMNVYDGRSDVTRLNDGAMQPVTVESDTWHVIERSLYFAKLSDGAFDITVRPLIQLWKAAQEENALPEKAEVNEVLAAIGARQIRMLPDNRIQLLHPKTKVDLGGIAKGYGIDEAARILSSYGYHHFFIDAGGDVYVGGKNCKGKKWQIGIRDPRDLGKILDIIAVSNQAVTTSGNYEQFFEIQGNRYSHILDPSSGYPQENVVSATAIAPSAEDADALATAMTVMGATKGIELLEDLGWDHRGIIITLNEDGSIQRKSTESYHELVQ